VDGYTLRVYVSVFSPTDGAVVDARLDGSATALGSGGLDRRAVGVVTVDLAPGQHRVLELTLLTGPRPGAATAPVPRLWTTPTVTPWRIDYQPAHRC
jgi:hypothetical protein